MYSPLIAFALQVAELIELFLQLVLVFLLFSGDGTETTTAVVAGRPDR